MSNRHDPIALAAIANANELGLVLSELSQEEIMNRARRLQAEAHAELWGRLFRAIGRLFRPTRTHADEATARREPTLANDDKRDKLAA